MDWTIAFRRAAVFAASNQPAYRLPGDSGPRSPPRRRSRYRL